MVALLMAFALLPFGYAVVVAATLFTLVDMARSEQASTTFRDATGRMTGSASIDRNGTQTFRDAQGRVTGTATIDSNGTTTFRDGSGRTTGTATRQR